MKRIILSITSIIICIALCFTMTSCNAGVTAAPRSISLVLGAHKYFPAITLSSQNIYKLINQAAYSYGDCSVIIVDGDPYMNADYHFEKPEKSIDDAKRKQIAKQNTEQIIVESQQAFARTEEIDTLAAITKSAACLRSADNEEKTMLVYDSGFSTKGLLNFAESNLINANVEKLADRLNELHAIPDLNGIHVIWAGMGEVCGEQNRLTENYKHKLQNIWSAVIEAGGGEITLDESGISSEEVITSLPDCSTIPVIIDNIDVNTITDLEKSAENKVFENPIKLDNDTVKFVGDSNEFIDPDAAQKELKPIADYLSVHTGTSIVIAGTTASAGDEEDCINLSKERADACKNLLIEFGVNENRILCIGLGKSDNCFHVDDLDEHGNLIEPYASQNRAVYIFDAASRTAELFR